MKARLAYVVAAVVVFTVEVLIAIFVHDQLVRPYIGDILAVVLVYLGIRAVMDISVGRALIAACIIAVVIEFAQLFHLLEALGLSHNRLARIVLGGVFDVKDLVCYAFGAVAVLMVEMTRRQRLFGAR